MNSPETPWPTARIAWTVTALLTVTYTIAFMHRIGLSLFVEPMRQDFNLTDTQVGLLTGAFFAIPYTLTAPLAGWLIDRFNRVKLLALAGAVWSIATAAGMASYGALAVGRIIAGGAQSVVQPGSASIIADLFPPDRRTNGFALFVAGTAFGTTVAYFAGALAIDLGRTLGPMIGVHDWQAAWLILGLIGLLIPLTLLPLREPVRRERSKDLTSNRAVKEFLQARAFVFGTLFLGVAVVFAAAYGELAFMPSLFIRKYGWTAQEVAWIFGSVAVVVGTLGSLSAGWMAAWLARRGSRQASWLTCIFGAVATLLSGAIAPLMPTGTLCMTLFAVSGFFTNYPAVAALAAISDITPNDLRGRVTAIYTATIGLLSAALGPFLVGSLNDRLGGIDTSLSVTFFACAVIATALLAAGMPGFRRLNAVQSAA